MTKRGQFKRYIEFRVRCKDCGGCRTSYETTEHRARKDFRVDGWAETAKGWICGDCRPKKELAELRSKR